MENVWILASIWVGFALIAALVAIQDGSPHTVIERLVGKGEKQAYVHVLEQTGLRAL